MTEHMRIAMAQMAMGDSVAENLRKSIEYIKECEGKADLHNRDMNMMINPEGEVMFKADDKEQLIFLYVVNSISSVNIT